MEYTVTYPHQNPVIRLSLREFEALPVMERYADDPGEGPPGPIVFKLICFNQGDKFLPRFSMARMSRWQIGVRRRGLTSFHKPVIVVK